MKKHLLFNQSFGTVGSPNQTDETLTRENRIGLKSYLHRTLMLLFAVLVLSIANIGMAWGETATFSGDNLNAAAGDKTVGSITLSTSNMTYSSGLVASSAGKSFTVTASGDATISQVLITMNGTSNRYKTSSVTNCTSCTREGSVYTCIISPAVAAVTCTTDGGGVTVTQIVVTYTSSGGGGGGDPATGTGTITYTLTKGSSAVSGAVTGVSTISGLASSFTTSTLAIGSDSKDGYCGKITKQPESYSASAYVDLPFTVASGYTFTPSSVSVQVNIENSTSYMKAKVAIIDNSLNVVSNELSCAKSTDNSVSFTSGAFTGKLYSGTVHIRIYLYGVTSKYAYIKSPITITGTVASAASGCPYYSFHTGGNDVKENNTQSCFVNYTSTEEWQLRDYTIPADTKFFVGNRGYWYNSDLGNNHSKSVAKTWAEEMYLARSFDSGDAAGSPKLGQATGATGTIRIYDNSNWNNLNAAFIPDGYKLKVGSTEYAMAVHDGNEYRSDIVEMSSSNARSNISVGVIDGSGNYVATANSEGMQHIFLNTGGTTYWSADGVSDFGLYDDTDGHKYFTCLMTQVPGESNLYEGWVPSNCTKVIFCRLKSSTPAWGDGNSNVYNYTNSLSLQTNQNYWTVTGWGGGDGNWSAYAKKGKFRMNDNFKDKNWYVRFYPYHVLHYDANGGSGAPADASVASDAVPCQWTLSTTQPTWADHVFLGWSTNSSAAVPDAASEVADLGSPYPASSDVTLYAVWSACSGPTITAFSNNEGHNYNQGDAATTMSITASAGNGGALHYHWYQYNVGQDPATHSVDAVGYTDANTYTPSTASAHGEQIFYCVVSEEGCSTTAKSAYSGAIAVIEPADPCSEPTKVANEIARFFVPCNQAAGAAWNPSGVDASTDDNTFTITNNLGGSGDFGGDNWKRNATTGFKYGKMQSSTTIQLQLKSGSFQAGDIVTVYVNGTSNNVKMNTGSDVSFGEYAASGYDGEYTHTKTLAADNIEDDGSIKIKRTNDIFINRIIVTRPPVAATITATLLTPEYMPTGATGVQIGVTITGASTGWYYRVKKGGGYETPGNTTYTTTTWTMTSTIGAGANTYTVELYNGSGTKMAESNAVTVTGETGHPMTIAAGANGTVSPSGLIYANGEHLHPEITANPASGYHFVNWTKDNENATLANANAATTTITNASGACTITANFAADATLYTVTFNSNGGSAVSPIGQASEGASITMPAAPTYADHTFQGWVIGGTTKAAGASYTPTANVTAYATWQADCAGGGSGSTITIGDFETNKHDKSNGKPDSNAKYQYGYTNPSSKTAENAVTITTSSGNSGYQNSGTDFLLYYSNTMSIYADNTTTGGTPASFDDITAISIKIKNYNTTTFSSFSIAVGGTTIADHVSLDNSYNSYKTYYCNNLSNLDGKIIITNHGTGGSNKSFYIDDIVISTGGGSSATCRYVTYDGNGADGGSVSDKTAYTSGTNVTVLGNVNNPAAFTKTGYRFNGWNTADNGSGMAYAAGATFNISENVTLYAQWVLDACSAPAAPTISGTASRTEGQNIELTATCASGADGSTTYTWYKGETWGSKSQVQAAMTAGAGGRTFTKASCVVGDAGKYWCEASNGTGCEAHNETGFTVTVSAAVEEHIYYYKDANHYSDGTYSNPEGNTAVKKDNQSLSSPWMICNGCKAGVDSVVAHGATYDGKGNHMNAYIKLPTGGDATTKNIKFALTEGYTGTLTMKIGGYENNPTVTLQPLVAGVLGDAIAYTGTVGGVATTENNFGEITWNLSTAGGTYVLTVTSKTGYISQIDMTTATTATFRVTYDGNGKTGGSVPTDATNYSANASVTAAAQGSMVKTNYTFGGWNTANNGTGTNYVAGSGTFNITGATTLYAHWTQSIYLAPGAHGTGSLGATVSWNGTAVRGFTAHTAAGYSLTGYYTDLSGGTKVLNSDGSFAATNVTDYITDGKWSRTGAEATLYAQWSGSAIVTNTLGVGSSSKWKSTISTTAPLQITDLSALAAVGGLAIEDANGTSADGRALTCKVEASGATTKTDGKYLQLSFSIAAGYKLRVTGLDVTVRSVSKAGKYHLELVGTTGSLIPDDEQVASGAVNTIFDDAYNVELTGDVTLKLWAYGKDGSNLMEYYRLGSPIAIYGAVEESCTPPTFSGLDYSATEYTQGAAASAISVTGAANVDSYQWKYNTVNDRTSGTNCGTGSSVTPATDASATTDGTRYYWCELTNECTTVKTSTVAVTVSASASNPTVTWSDVKLNGEATTVNYGGGKYELRATVNETTWSGTLESSMVTAPAGIYIHNIGIGTEASKQYIEFQFDVTTAFDREENETIDFHLSLPAISGTPNWNALTSDKQVSYTACDEGEGAAGQVAIPLTSTAQTSASNPQNYWEVAEAGWLAFNYGSAVSVLPAATAYRTSEVDFGYYVATTNKKKWMFQPYIAGVNKVRVAFRAAGNLSSGQASVSKFYYDTEYFSSPGSHENLIGDVSANQATYTSGENGYIEFTVPEMAANSYGAFELANSSIEIYGIVLYSENTGSGGTIETDPTWSGGLNKNGSSIVDKNQGDPNFTYTISTTTNTLGGITYSSSNPSVAEVNATTGEVRITATGESTQTAVITATLARSGCYQPATRTYTVRVAGQECTITSAGTLTADKTSKCESDDVVLSLSGHDTDGTTVTWYRDETDVTSSVSNNTLTTSTPGAYSVVVSKSGCSLRSNTVNITNISAATSATKIVDKWYIKNGRLTPDIALWRLDEGTTFKSVAWSPANSTGLNFNIRDGIVYLEGKEPSANETGADKVYTLTLTVTDICGTDHELTDKTITLTHQKNTDKHVLAFVVTGKEKGGFTESISADQTTKVGLYNEIAKNFDVLATNIYSTDDEQKIKEYYSQFDIICITDYPNTKTKGSHSKSYSDAIGVMVDIRPVLTMEAWVSGLANWKAKGIRGDPKSPSTRQYSMLLQCKDHEIFAGTTLTEVGEGDEKMYRIHMVDETLHPYDTLDANYGSGTHESKKGYRYGSYPALQGFTFSQAMEDADLLPLGLIDDGAGNDLQVGLERQHEMSARMMVLGINSTAMERLTDDGERVVINALKYLMKKNAEDIADCSTSFVGGADGDETNWMNADNWTGNTVPDKTQKVRILAPCVVPEGERAHVAGVLIAPNDGGTYNGGSTPTTGSLTIAAGGALVVDGKIQAVTAPAYNRPRTTAPADLAVLTDADAQGALIFDNSEGETQATVQMYSPSYWTIMEGTNKKKSYWSYVAIPIQDAYVGEFFYGAVTYLYDETAGWIRKRIGTHLHAFEGIGLSLPEGHTETFYGPLAPTEDRTVTLTKTTSGGDGENLIGNSWTAPIQIANFEASDFGSATQNVMIYSTGRDGTQDGVRENAVYETATEENDGNVSAGQWVSIPINVPSLDGYDGLKVIPAMQAFQVTTGTETSLTLNYDKLVRDVNIVSDNLTEKQHAPARRSAGAKKSLMSTMRVRVSGVKTRTDVWLLEDDRFSEAFDNGWEATYAECDDRSAQLYAQSETGNMSFLAKPDIEGTVLGFAPSKDGNQYLFTFHYVGDDEYYLNDLKLTTATLISNENNYLFTYEEGDTNRFYISRQPLGAPAVATGMDNPREEAKPRKFIYKDKMYILYNGRVFDATGKVVK